MIAALELGSSSARRDRLVGRVYLLLRLMMWWAPCYSCRLSGSGRRSTTTTPSAATTAASSLLPILLAVHAHHVFVEFVLRAERSLTVDTLAAVRRRRRRLFLAAAAAAFSRSVLSAVL